MTARPDGLPDLAELGRSWREMELDPPVTPVLGTLRETVRRRGREMYLVLAGEIALTLAAITLAVTLLRQGMTTVSLTTAVIVGIVSTVTWGFAVWNRRGTWRPLGESMVDYVRLTRRRILAGRRSVRFVRISMALAATVYAPALVQRVRSASLDATQATLGLCFALYLAGMLAWSVWYAGRLQRDLEEVEAIEATLGPDAEN